jgi:hypothetical protein
VSSLCHLPCCVRVCWQGEYLGGDGDTVNLSITKSWKTGRPPTCFFFPSRRDEMEKIRFKTNPPPPTRNKKKKDIRQHTRRCIFSQLHFFHIYFIYYNPQLAAQHTEIEFYIKTYRLYLYIRFINMNHMTRARNLLPFFTRMDFSILIFHFQINDTEKLSPPPLWSQPKMALSPYILFDFIFFFFFYHFYDVGSFLSLFLTLSLALLLTPPHRHISDLFHVGPAVYREKTVRYISSDFLFLLC